MPTQDIYLSVVIPAYNEERRIAKTIQRLHTYLSRQAYSYEIIVVIDGARDGTVRVVESLKSSIPNLRLIDRKENRGKGYTVREGMLAAQGKIRLFTDADNSTDIAYFANMRPFFDKGYEMVVATRNPRDAAGATQEVSQVWYKRILGIAGNLFIQIVAVRGIWDTQTGFKAFRNFAAEKIFSQTHIYRWGFDVEVLALARALRYKIGIIPIHWFNDSESHVKFLAYFQVLWETVKVRWYLARGYYNLSKSEARSPKSETSPQFRTSL